MTCCMRKVRKFSLICFVVSLRILCSLWCFRNILECRIVSIELRLHRSIFDMMRQWIWTSSRKCKLYLWNVGERILLKVRAWQPYKYTVQFMTWWMRDITKFPLTYFVFSLELLSPLECVKTFQHAIPTWNCSVQLMTWCMWEVMKFPRTCFAFSLELLRSL